MKPNAYFINTARGKIHDEAALLEALTARRIAGAGIDVFDVEPPPPDHPLLHLDTVMATPHIAGGTVETMHDMSKAAAEQWIALLRGRVPPRLVNPEVWPRYSRSFRTDHRLPPRSASLDLGLERTQDHAGTLAGRPFRYQRPVRPLHLRAGCRRRRDRHRLLRRRRHAGQPGGRRAHRACRDHRLRASFRAFPGRWIAASARDLQPDDDGGRRPRPRDLLPDRCS